MRQLLELRVAQTLGCRVAVINHSVEVDDPFLLRLIGTLYSMFDRIIVREHLSLKAIVDMGVPEEKVRMAADAAFLAKPAEDSVVKEILLREAIGPNTVAISVDIDSASERVLEWGKIIRAIQSRDKQVIFVSNCLWGDYHVASEFQRKFGIRVMSRQYDYPEYIGLLANVEMVISSRLHTCVFSMIGNTPIIPIEPNIRKVTGLFQLTNYPVSVIDPSDPNWVGAVLNSIDYVYEHHATIKKNLTVSVRQLRTSATGNVCWDDIQPDLTPDLKGRH